MITYGSVCSGIEAASVAWEPLGFTPLWFSQFDPEHNYSRGPDFPSLVLAHHWPHIPNLGDMMKLAEKVRSGEIPAPDVLVGGPPCFTAGHMVLTEKGYRPIESILPGDRVVSHTGKLCRVKRIGNKKAQVGKLTGIGLRAGVICTAEHPFRAVHWQTQFEKKDDRFIKIEHVGKPEWRKACDMKGYQWCALTTFNIPAPKIISAKFNDYQAMYMAGFYVGDGYIRRTTGRNKKAVVYGVNPNKVEKIRAVVGDHLPKPQVDRTSIKLSFSDTAYAEWLIEHFSEYSDRKTIPAWVMSHPLREAFLQGYIDADGSRDGEKVTINSVSVSLSYGVVALAQSLGYAGSTSKIKVAPTKLIEGRTVKQKPYYQNRLTPREITNKCRVHHEMILRRADDFIPLDVQTVFNIEVEGDNSYILNNAIVHNCQAFSISGLRTGLSDPRGQLTIAYGELADVIDQCRAAAGLPPCIIVWENVPGVFSSKDNAYGVFLALLAGEVNELQPPGKKWTDAGYIAGPKRTIAWRVLNAEYFGVAQRRRRVFVVASARKDINPAKILFEWEGLRRDIAPSRSPEEVIAPTSGSSAKTSSHWDSDTSPHPTLSHSCGKSGGIGMSNQAIFSQRGAGLVGVYRMVAFGEYTDDGTASTLKARDYKDATDLAVTYSLQHAQIGRKDSAGPQGKGWLEELNFTLDSRGTSDAIAHCTSGFAFAQNSRDELRLQGGDGEIAGALSAQPGIKQTTYWVDPSVGVRRLTAVETERLQGFPDNFTLIPVAKRRPIAEDELAYLKTHRPGITAADAAYLSPNGQRYKALGNSMAVPVMRWIGKRIKNHFKEAVI